MAQFDEDEELLEEYARYVRSVTGIPDDYDTWVQSGYGESRKRSRKPKNHGGGKYYDY
jgi:hypothetical protein